MCIRDSLTLDAFRGHIVNGDEFTAEARRPDPERLLGAYHQSVATLNLLRAFTTGGFAALSRVHAWNQEFVANSLEGKRYSMVADEIERALLFMKACGIDLHDDSALQGVDFYTSHEALILPLSLIHISSIIQMRACSANFDNAMAISS